MKNEKQFLKKNASLPHLFARHKGVVALDLLALVVAGLVVAALAWRQPLLVPATLLPLLLLPAGGLHAWLLVQRLPSVPSQQRWWFTVAMAAVVLVLIGSLAWWVADLPWRTGLAAAAAFLIPFVLTELWRLYAAISYEGAIPWQAPAATADEFPSIYLNGIPVRFRILGATGGGAARPIAYLASGKMTLGEAFKDMVQKQSRKGPQQIALRNEEGRAYNWIFYTTDMLIWTRVLHPHQSLKANSIGKNAVIYALPAPGENEPVPSRLQKITIES